MILLPQLPEEPGLQVYATTLLAFSLEEMPLSQAQREGKVAPSVTVPLCRVKHPNGH